METRAPKRPRDKDGEPTAGNGLKAPRLAASSQQSVAGGQQHATNVPRRAQRVTILHLPTELLYHIWSYVVASVTSVSELLAVYDTAADIFPSVFSVVISKTTFWQLALQWLSPAVTAALINVWSGGPLRSGPRLDLLAAGRYILHFNAHNFCDCWYPPNEGMKRWRARQDRIQRLWQIAGPHIRTFDGRAILNDKVNLSLCKSLRRLALGRSNIRLRSAVVVSVLNGNQNSLEHLEFTNDFRDDDALAAPASQFFQAVGLCASLTVLSLSSCHVNAEAATLLSSALSNCKSLEVVDLSCNNLRDGFVDVVRALRNCSRLRDVDFTDCDLMPSGAVALADAVNDWPELSVVVLVGNGDMWANRQVSTRCLASLLARPSMCKLDVAGWSPAMAGVAPVPVADFAKALVQALRTGSNVKVLGLRLWPFTDAQVASIVTGLKRCRSLRAVRFEGDCLRDKRKDLLRRALRHVDKIILGGNSSADRAWDRIMDWSI